MKKNHVLSKMDGIVFLLFLFLLSFQKVGNNHESYRKSSIKRPRMAYLFQAHLRGGGGGLHRDGGLFNLEKTMVSVLHKELDTKWKSSSTRRLEVMQTRIRIKSELSVGK